MHARSSTHARSNALGISGIRGASVGCDSGFRARAGRAGVPLRRAAKFRGAPKPNTVEWMWIDRLQPNWRRVAGRRNRQPRCFARWQGLLDRKLPTDRKPCCVERVLFWMQRRCRLPIVNWFRACPLPTTQSSGTAPPLSAAATTGPTERTDGSDGSGLHALAAVIRNGAGSLPHWHPRHERAAAARLPPRPLRGSAMCVAGPTWRRRALVSVFLLGLAR